MLHSITASFEFAFELHVIWSVTWTVSHRTSNIRNEKRHRIEEKKKKKNENKIYQTQHNERDVIQLAEVIVRFTLHTLTHTHTHIQNTNYGEQSTRELYI